MPEELGEHIIKSLKSVKENLENAKSPAETQKAGEELEAELERLTQLLAGG